MNRVEELIRQLCPNGVEWKKLGEIGSIIRGNGLQKKDFTEKGVGCIHYGQIYTYYNTFTYSTKSFVAKGLADKLTKVNKGDVIIACTSENVEDVCKAVAWLGDDTIVTGGHACVFKHQENPKFISYYFQSEFFFQQKKKYARGTKVIDIKASDLEEIVIPTPPLPIQQEIVRILDTFTELTANLQTELEARKKQYAYYRDCLLNFEGVDGVEWKKMGEIGTFIRGKRFVRADIVEGGIPCIHYGDVYTFYGLSAVQTKGMLRSDLAAKMRYAHKNDVVIVAAGENKDDIGIGVAWLGKEDAAVHDACFIFRSDMDPNFVSHYLRTNNYHLQIKKYVSEGKICSISADGLGNIMIPIPPLPEQHRIVAILDNFETLVNDLTVGLPAELRVRRKQYEYYRDKLLTFDRV